MPDSSCMTFGRLLQLLPFSTSEVMLPDGQCSQDCHDASNGVIADLCGVRCRC